MESWPPKVAEALLAAIRDARPVAKDGYNPQHKYPYAKAESIIDEGRGALARNGLMLIPLDTTILQPAAETATASELDVGGDDGERPTRRAPKAAHVVRVTMALVHESGDQVRFHRDWYVVDHKGRPLDKSEGGALTTLLAYAYRDLLSLPRDDELAAMDRRDDRGYEPDRSSDYDDHAPQRDDTPAPSRAAEVPRRQSDDPYNDILEAIRRGVHRDEIEREIAAASLPEDSRKSLRFVLRAYEARNTQEFGRVGADIRASDMARPWIEHTLSVIRPAWDALNKRAA